MPASPHHGQCACGKVQFSVRGLPLLRAFCHCTICQQFNQAPFADISVFSAGAVQLPDPTTLEYRTYRPPPAVQRGKCRSCGKPAIETMQIFPMPKLIIVPTANLPPNCWIEPVLHAFYQSRVADIDDNLPKYSGYLHSQWAFTRKLMSAVMRRRAAG